MSKARAGGVEDRVCKIEERLKMTPTCTICGRSEYDVSYCGGVCEHCENSGIVRIERLEKWGTDYVEREFELAEERNKGLLGEYGALLRSTEELTEQVQSLRKRVDSISGDEYNKLSYRIEKLEAADRDG